MSRLSPRAVAADLAGAVARWRVALPLEGERWLAAPGADHEGHFREIAERAIELVVAAQPAAGASPPEPPGPPSRPVAPIVVVPKLPHAGDPASLAAIVARLLAFGVHVEGLRPIAGRSGADVAGVLYPQAKRYFEAPPPGASAFGRALAERFDDPRFAAVMGVPFTTDLVVSGAEVIERFGVSPGRLAAIWEEGRRPIPRPTLLRRYGATACDAVLPAGEPSYAWFRGDWPFGIQRFGPGLAAFALRHEEIGGGRPLVVVNGHFPGLSRLFEGPATVIDAGIDPAGPHIADVRAYVVGDDSRPGGCRPGSIRRDAADGLFPAAAPTPVDARHNVVHCSDGLVAGTIERVALLGGEPAGEIVDRLLDAGLTTGEVEGIVLADPIVDRDADARLTDATRGQDLSSCLSTVSRLVPPVFGEANRFAGGVALPAFACRAAALARSRGRLEAVEPPLERWRDLSERPLRVGELGGCRGARERAGRALLAAGGVGVVTPAAGTGGRFGGYGLDESDPGRQKPLAPVFRLAGRPVSSLDVRLANLRHWRRALRGEVRLAVMAGPTNRPHVAAWVDHQVSAGATGVEMFEQAGVYRLDAGSLAAGDGDAARWMDHIARAGDGRPSLKPAGTLGALTAFALGGTYDKWRERGVEVIVVASGDDVGFRLDPRIVGHLQLNPEIDAIVVGTAPSFRARLVDGDRFVEVRGDLSGWCIDDRGRRLVAEPAGAGEWAITGGDGRAWLVRPSVDLKGVLGEVWTGEGWRVGLRPPGTLGPGLPPGTGPTAGGGGSAPGPGPAQLRYCQLYLRGSSLDPLLAAPTAEPGSPHACPAVGGVHDLVASLPLAPEHKDVRADGARFRAIQFHQPVGDVLRRLRRVVTVAIDNDPRANGRGGSAPLKVPADVAFGQLLLDRLAELGDEVALLVRALRTGPV